MTATGDLLLEIGTEELPTLALPSMAEGLERAVAEGLAAADLAFSGITRYATPRRLAVVVEGLAAVQPDRDVSRRGPALAAAFDADGNPTRAAIGFARSCGVEVADLETVENDKGRWLGFSRREAGRHTRDVLPDLLDEAVRKIPVPKRMRWADSEVEFARPVQWVVLLFAGEVVPACVLGCPSSNVTRGHRFHAPAPITIESARDYAPRLEAEGRVVAGFEERRRRIETGVRALAEKSGVTAVVGPDLLDEVTALVEWPVPVIGSFDEAYLVVPEEALIAVMRDHQKYFHVVDDEGRLLPRFITVSNIESRDPDAVVTGNERVIRPRLADAKFFFDMDRQRPLASRFEALADVVYQKKLGTLADKTRRVAALAEEMAAIVPGEPAHLARAAHLSRCDLTTQMVYEFPEMQGVAGRYYARHDGEPAEVAAALEEFYLPRHAGDDLPASPVGRALAIADRIDSLVGIFGIGQEPTGDKDPFGLRRAALGLVRIMIEARVDCDLRALLEAGVAGYRGILTADDVVGRVQGFVLDRLRHWYLDAGVPLSCFEAVAAAPPASLVDFDERLKAVRRFTGLSEAAALSAANKRIANILRKSAGDTTVHGDGEVDDGLLVEPAERTLAAQLESASSEIAPFIANRDYAAALSRLADLRESVDGFFDAVMVMTDDPALRGNRIALLHRLHRTFLQIADVGRLQRETS